MQRLVTAIEQSVESQNWYAAIYVALTMPDVCAKLETPDGGRPGYRYKDWFNRYLARTYTSTIGGQEVVFLSAADCWALRCSILHEGSEDITEQQARDVLRRVCFTTLGPHLIKANDTLTVNVAAFCREFCQGVERWIADVAGNAGVQRRMGAMVTIREGPFSPIPGVQIG